MAYIQPMLQVLIVVGIGMLLAWKTDIKKHVRMLSLLIMYVLIPAVVFRSAYQSSMRLADCLDYYGVLFSVYTCTLLASYLLCRILRLEGPDLRTFCINGPYSNNGAAGYTIIQAFLGDYYGGIAAVASAYSNVLINITGPIIIRAGSGGHLREALKGLVKMPVIYALLLGYLLKGLGVKLPDLLLTPINQLASAAFPLCLLLIGVQIQGQKLKGRISRLLLPSGIKLLLMPLIALVLIRFVLHVSMPHSVVVFLLAAMPPASTMVAIASSYGTKYEAEAVSSVTCFATVMSILTIPCMLYLSAQLFL